MNTTIEHADTGERREAEVLRDVAGRPTLIRVPLWGDAMGVSVLGYLMRGRKETRWRVVAE